MMSMEMMLISTPIRITGRAMRLRPTPEAMKASVSEFSDILPNPNSRPRNSAAGSAVPR